MQNAMYRMYEFLKNQIFVTIMGAIILFLIGITLVQGVFMDNAPFYFKFVCAIVAGYMFISVASGMLLLYSSCITPSAIMNNKPTPEARMRSILATIFNWFFYIVMAAMGICAIYIIIGLFCGGPVIDLWDETPTSHIFGYWEESPGLFKCNFPPSRIVEIPIENGNYVGNPSELKINLWLADSVVHPENFTIEGYYKSLE